MTTDNGTSGMISRSALLLSAFFLVLCQGDTFYQKKKLKIHNIIRTCSSPESDGAQNESLSNILCQRIKIPNNLPPITVKVTLVTTHSTMRGTIVLIACPIVGKMHLSSRSLNGILQEH